MPHVLRYGRTLIGRSAHSSRQIRAGSGTIAVMRIEQIGEWGEAHFREPATPKAIDLVEATLGQQLPHELRELLAETNGIEGEYALGLLWTAERIASDNRLFRTSPALADLYMPFDGVVF